MPPGPGAVPAVWGSLIVVGSQKADATTTPARIARPPSAGVARSASPRSEGMTTAPTRQANRAVSGVSTAATPVATRNAKKASQYRMPWRKGWQGRRTGAGTRDRVRVLSYVYVKKRFGG